MASRLEAHRRIVAVYAALFLVVSVVSIPSQWPQGQDFAMYRDATARWLAGGSFYLPHQLAGPYTIAMGDVLYPPTMLVLFAPFTILPAFLWWAVPLAATAAALVRLRPRAWTWPILAICAGFFQTRNLVAAGNPLMWLVPAVMWGLPVALLLKPTLAPFALIGVRSRRWWIGLAALVAVSAVSLPMWGDYAAVLLDAQDNRPVVLHALIDVPFVLFGVIAWIGAATRGGPSPVSE